MKITVRIPTDQYAYIEAEFATIDEYSKEYPKLAQTVLETRKKAKELITK